MMNNNEVKENSREFKNFIGIDVAKYKFDIYNDINGECKTIANEKQFIEKCCDYLDKLLEEEKLNKNDILVVIDLTGGYEKEIVNTFYTKGYINILLAEGLKVKNFSKTTKYNRAKTDKQDAIILSEYGKMFHKSLKFYKPVSENREEITIIYNRIEDLKDLLKRDKTRKKAPNTYNNPSLMEDIEMNIESLEERIKALKKRLFSIIERDKELNVIYDTLIKQDGIGEEIALFLLVRIRELGRIEKKQLASICGLAPVANDSGTYSGHRYARGGRAEIRSKMFLCILNMIRFNEDTRNKINYYHNRGKNKKVAILTLARKKIVVINARVRDALKEAGL